MSEYKNKDMFANLFFSTSLQTAFDGEFCLCTF